LLAPALRYQADVDFAGGRVSLEDALLAYQAAQGTELIGGYFKPPITSDELTSDLFTLFLERSAFATSFAPGRRVGAGVAYRGQGWGLRGGVFGERDDAILDRDRSEGWLVAGRAHADILPGDGVLHAAVSGYFSRIGSERLATLSLRPETNRAPPVLNTGSFEADGGGFIGAELGYGGGPITVQAEGGKLAYRGGPADPRFWGFSAQLGWRITGEERPYDAKSGIFGRLTPEGRSGAVEAGLRFTHVDLDDEGVDGGRLTTYGAVLNWYPVTRLRIAGNIIHAVTDRAAGTESGETLLTVRGGIDW
jgi:phosphate-selective porin OprO/OprP